MAAIGSVVTAPRHRGRGLSRQLQQELLGRLADDGVPLAVLWSDRPQLYEKRGFRAAGIEYHVALESVAARSRRTRAHSCAPMRADDAHSVADLYAGHAYVTRRRRGEAPVLYAMPGTSGWVPSPRRAPA